MTSSEITHMQPCPDFYHVEFTYLLQVGAICLHYSHDDVIG